MMFYTVFHDLQTMVYTLYHDLNQQPNHRLLTYK